MLVKAAAAMITKPLIVMMGEYAPPLIWLEAAGTAAPALDAAENFWVFPLA